MVAIQSDVMVCRIQHTTHLLADKVPLYAYEFLDRTAPSFFPDLPDFEPLAYHTADLQYQFPGFHGGAQGIRHPLNAAQQHLSDQIVASWTNFAKTGNPNAAGKNDWPPYTGTADGRTYAAQNQGGVSTMTDDDFTAEHKCGFWKGILVYE